MYYFTVITVAVGKTALLFGSPSLMWLVIIHFRPTPTPCFDADDPCFRALYCSPLLSKFV